MSNQNPTSKVSNYKTIKVKYSGKPYNYNGNIISDGDLIELPIQEYLMIKRIREMNINNVDELNKSIGTRIALKLIAKT